MPKHRREQRGMYNQEVECTDYLVADTEAGTQIDSPNELPGLLRACTEFVDESGLVNASDTVNVIAELFFNYIANGVKVTKLRIALDNCPFCMEPVTMAEEQENMSENIYYVDCENCKARGPVSDGVLTAATKWNDLRI